MSEAAPFIPRPRVARRHAPSFDAGNFLRELDVIVHSVKRVAAVPVETFSVDCPEYDSAYIVIIRLAVVLEPKSTHPYMDALTSPEKRALRTTRNIAAHSGYQSMDDQLL